MSTEDEEYYYDSIDDSEFERCRSFCNSKFQDDDSEVEDECLKQENLVPFYKGNVDKSEVDSLKNNSLSSSLTNLKNKLRKKRPVPVLEKRRNRSYLTMFYARNGSKAAPQESTRATCSSLTPRSYFSCDNEEKTSNANFYEENLLDSTQSVVHNSNYVAPSFATLDTQLYSVSEAHLNPNLHRNKKPKAKPVKITELGSLGPNIAQDKLELLRRRQAYGMTASQKNRIKILENRVVQKLKEEIRNSNKF